MWRSWRSAEAWHCERLGKDISEGAASVALVIPAYWRCQDHELTTKDSNRCRVESTWAYWRSWPYCGWQNWRSGTIKPLWSQEDQKGVPDLEVELFTLPYCGLPWVGYNCTLILSSWNKKVCKLFWTFICVPSKKSSKWVLCFLFFYWKDQKHPSLTSCVLPIGDLPLSTSPSAENGSKRTICQGHYEGWTIK